jgi:hypothetical protein
MGEEIRRISEFDFFHNVVVALAHRARETGDWYIPSNPPRQQSVSRRFVRVFDALVELGSRHGVMVRFHLALHPLHGDSLQVGTHILYMIGALRMVVQEIPSGDLRIKRWVAEVEIPEPVALWKELAEVFLAEPVRPILAAPRKT